MVTEGEAKDLLKQFLPGADLTGCAMDEPIPDTPEINAAAKRFRVFVEKDGRRMTLRELTDTGFGSWILIGTPAQITKQIEDYVELVGEFEVASLQVNFSDLAYSVARPSMELFAREVMPKFTAARTAVPRRRYRAMHL